VDAGTFWQRNATSALVFRKRAALTIRQFDSGVAGCTSAAPLLFAKGSFVFDCLTILRVPEQVINGSRQQFGSGLAPSFETNG
jgi:hypothetical protein